MIQPVAVSSTGERGRDFEEVLVALTAPDDVESTFLSMQSTVHQELEDPPVFDTIYCRKRSMISNVPH